MTMKKKLMSGALAATLGISMVGLGTWAAFNDVETVDASIAAGTLKMDLAKVGGKPYAFSINNLKPGDSMTREVQFVNKGTLAIKEVLMTIEDVQFQDYAPGAGEAGDGDAWVVDRNTDKLDYLDQFEVTVFAIGTEGGGKYSKELLINPVSLKDFYLAADSLNTDKGVSGDAISAARTAVYNAIAHKNYIKGNRINVTTETNDGFEGVPVDPTDVDRMEIKVEFKDDVEKKYADGSYMQNRYQGNSANITLSFEARQWGGQEVTDSDIGDGKKGKAVDGYIKTNEKSKSEGPEVQQGS